MKVILMLTIKMTPLSFIILETMTFYDFDSQYEYLENYYGYTDQAIGLVPQNNQTLNKKRSLESTQETTHTEST